MVVASEKHQYRSRCRHLFHKLTKSNFTTLHPMSCANARKLYSTLPQSPPVSRIRWAGRSDSKSTSMVRWPRSEALINIFNSHVTDATELPKVVGPPRQGRFLTQNSFSNLPPRVYDLKSICRMLLHPVALFRNTHKWAAIHH